VALTCRGNLGSPNVCTARPVLLTYPGEQCKRVPTSIPPRASGQSARRQSSLLADTGMSTRSRRS